MLQLSPEWQPMIIYTARGVGLYNRETRASKPLELALGEGRARVLQGLHIPATTSELAHRLAAVGRRFAPDPAIGECTVGGMLATNASGARLLKYGYTRDHVASLRAVLDNAEAVAACRLPRVLPAPTSARLDDIASSTVTAALPSQSCDAHPDGTGSSPTFRNTLRPRSWSSCQRMPLSSTAPATSGRPVVRVHAAGMSMPEPGSYFHASPAVDE